MSKVPLTVGELIVVTAIRLKTIANRFVFSPNGTTSSQFRILRLLSNEGPQRPSAIMKYAGGTKSNVSQRINMLEEEGLVYRLQRKKGGDLRSVFVAVTPKGRKLFTKLRDKFKKSSRELEEHFSAKEIAGCMNFLKKLNKAIDENEQKIPKLFDK
ncbi:MAG: MarR family transcriptional regulator [Candidatus Peribacteraceae bacterium]|nr:MarR family transcriptional regulator [Candidatus Peribacteraceae bacterium]